MRPVPTCLLSVFLLTSMFQADARDFYVAPDGKDSGPGTRTAPFASLTRARDAVRAVAGREAVTVNVADGIYYLPETLVFTPADSGTKEAPVLYRAQNRGGVVVSGGTHLQLQWEPWKNGIFCAKVPAGLDTDQLFINGERQILARYPNFDPKQRIFSGYAADAVSSTRARGWSDPVGGIFHAMHIHQWGGFSYVITGKEADGSLRFDGGWQGNRASKPHETLRMVEGILEELDAPGEWFLARKTNTLYFLPPSGVDLATAKVEVVRLRHLVEFRGSEQQPVRFVTMRGFTFRHTAHTFMLTKEPLLRSDWTIYRGGAVLFEGAEDCTLEDGFFDQVGGNSVFVSNYNRRLAVRGCRIEKSGAGGVTFVGDPAAVRSPLFEYGQKQSRGSIDPAAGPKTNNYPADCLVEDCLITLTGRVEKQSTGVGIDMASRITVRHCSIYDMPRAGINIGDGCWGGHVIEFCDIFDTVKETGDHGSFNSWGRDRYWNLTGWNPQAEPEVAFLDVVEPIILRNTRWRCDHGWDIDLDDGSSHYQIYNNLCLNGGIKLREGYRRIVWNNILVNGSFHPHVWYRDSGDRFYNNIVMAAHRGVQVPTENVRGEEIDRNLFFGVPKEEIEKNAFAGWDKLSVTADPLFLDPATGDFRVRDDSPALKLGFRNFSMDEFGVQSPALKALARTPKLPALRIAIPTEPTKPAEKNHSWQGAIVRNLEGEAYSAFGVSKDSGGVILMEVPAGSGAAKAGLQANDLVQSLNGTRVRNIDELLRIQKEAGAKSLSVGYVRNQQALTLSLGNRDGEK